MKRIYFFAKVGDLNAYPYGGGEVGNRRTMNLFKELGYNIILIPRYCCYKPKNFWVYIEMILGDFMALICMFFKLLFGYRKNSIVHISGFTGAYMIYEMISILTAKLLGYKIVYEIRGGGIIGFFISGNFIYRNCFRFSIKMSECTFSQGLENKMLIEKYGPNKFFYYPNYVNLDFIGQHCPPKSSESYKLVYLGRITPSKNINLVIKCFEKVKKYYPNSTLDLIGDGEDYPSYVKDIKEYIKRNLSDCCTYHGKKNKNEIIDILKKMTFLIFPSNEKREGQSNSLTEAMSLGVIPIASPQGYSRSIINTDELIIEKLDADEYAHRIIKIINENKINYFSKLMYDRIKENYTYDKIKKNVSDKIIDLFK